jgi:hypothetical protein
VPAGSGALGVAVLFHSVFSQLLYVGIFIDLPESDAERRVRPAVVLWRQFRAAGADIRDAEQLGSPTLVP